MFPYDSASRDHDPNPTLVADRAAALYMAHWKKGSREGGKTKGKSPVRNRRLQPVRKPQTDREPS